MNAAEYQTALFEKLKHIFGETNVKKEWDVAKDSQDDYTRDIYCPRLDIAVGPFNIDRQIHANKECIEIALQQRESLIGRLIDASENYRGRRHEFLSNRNTNPRCLLAIEIEASGTRKHMLGDIANASILGAIGIVIPLTPERLRAFKKILNYIHFATAVGKLKPSFNNVLLVDKNFEF